MCISPKYEEFENSQHNRQCNTFWDGKKLLSDASSGGVESKNDEECGPQEASLHDVKVVYSSDKDVAVFCSESGVDTPSEKLTSKEIRDSKPGKYVSRHRDHHGLGNHHYPHHGKTFKSARDHGNGKPSFIVPKFKYGILKQRVPFFKGKSPFNAPQVKLKRFDAKCSSSSIKIPAELQCHFKKIEDNDNNYDSSFEDGDSEDAPLKLSMGKCPTRTPCISGQVVGDIKLPDNSLSPPSSLAEFQKRDNAKIDLKKDTRGDNEDKHHLSSSTDDQEVVRKLESKFNENLASIWSEQAKCETAPEKVSEMLESALMTSLSTWFSNLKKCDENPLVSDSNLAVGSKFHNESMPMADLEVCKSFHEMPNSSVNESRFDAEEYSKDEPHLKPDFDGFSVKNDKDDLSSNNIPLNDSYNEHKEDPSGIWYCESERNNFIKGGVYGFPKYHSQSDEDCTLSETDLYEISKGVLDTSSPAFESDVDTLFDERRSDLESKSVREDDVKLIWEVLGAINNDVKSGSQDEDSELLPVCPDDPEAKLKDEKIEGCNRKKEISVWEQLDHFDVWNMELISLKKNWDSTFPENANRPLPPFKDMSVLWDEAEITTDAVETLPVVTPNQDNALNLATALNWGGTESYHQSLWNIWKDGANDSTDVGSLIIECNLPNTVSSEEHLSMTRSYDSYLNKDNSGDGMDSLSKVQDQVHLSDPVLFGRKCTLTYHKGESLFVEVKHQKQDTNKWNSSRTNLTPGVLKSAAANVHLSNSVDDEPFNLYSSRNSDSTSNELEPYGDGDGYEEENLLTSPKTHFRPIRQLSCDSDDTLNSGDLHVDGTKPPTNLTDDIKVDKPLIVDYEIEPHGESIPDDDKPIFTEDESGILHLNSENEEGEKSCHHYMIYKGLESSKQQKEVVPAFVPKFKLRSNLEKFCQTEDLDGNQQRRWDQLNITENGCINSTSLESNYKEVHLPEIENDINHCERETESKKASVLKFFETISTFESKSMNSDNDWKTNTFENNHSYVVSQLEKDIISNFSMPDGDLNHYKNVDRIPETLWSAAEDDEDEEEEEEDEGCEGRDDTSPWPLNIDYNRRDNVDEKDFWAVDDKEDSSEAEELKTMKEEIKEEEAELFEDINQMRELDLHNDWDDGDEFSVNEMATMNDLQRKSLEWSPCNINLYQEVTVDCQEDEDCPELEMINGRQCELLSPWWLQNEDDGYTGEQDTADGLSSTCADWSSSYKEKVRFICWPDIVKYCSCACTDT